MKHIEDLPREQITHIVHNLHKMDVSEKIDGSNLVFGFDEKGQFYTTRMAKGQPERFYATADYADSPANNIFKAAHCALSTALSRTSHPDTEYEVEILYGRQPNAIVYGSNRIVFITPYPDEVQEPVIVNTEMVFSDDGKTLYTRDVSSTWEFSAVPFIRLRGILISSDMTTDNIKQMLVDKILREIKPAFRDVDDLTDQEDFGIEGIVIKDPTDGTVTKLVDKHTFTLINQFNFAIRNEIKATGPRFNPTNNRHLYDTFAVTVGYQQISIYDTMLSEFAELIGIPGLGKYMTITRTMKKYDNIDEFLQCWDLFDVQSAKSAFNHTVRQTIDRLAVARSTFIKQWTTYELVLTNGNTIKYTDEIYRRTLIVFAETLRELTEMHQKIEQSEDWVDLVNAIYKKQMRLAFPD